MVVTTRKPGFTSSRELYHGLFEGQHPLDFGRAGTLSPESWELSVIRHQQPGDTSASLQYELTVFAKIPDNPHGGVSGNFGSPAPGVMAEYAYGFGSAGFIHELPDSLVQEIQRDTGVDFEQEEQFIPYEYGYSHEENGLAPIPDFEGRTWWPLREQAEKARKNDLRWRYETFLIRRERPIVERV